MTLFGADTDPSILIQYGAIGIFLAFFVTGLIVPKWVKDYLVERAERAETQRDKMLQVYDQEILPILREVVQTHREIVPTLANAAGQLKDAGETLDEVHKTNRELVNAINRALDKLS